jgi:diguanylate cyclase (GGDEF)-like protein
MPASHSSNTHSLFEDIEQAFGDASSDEAAPLCELDAAQARSLLEATGGFAAQVDTDGRVHALTEASLVLLDYPKEYLAHASLADLVYPADKETFLKLLQRSWQQRQLHTATLRFTRGMTDSVWLHLRICPDPQAEAATPRLQLFGYDVSAWIATEAELRAGALLDPLTETGNRTQMREQISQAIAQSQQSGRGFSVALLDLDGFKKINATFGLDAGDVLLREVSRRLMSTLRTNDTVARLGGDEFVVLLPAVDNEKTVLEVASRMLMAIQAPFTLAGQQLYLTTSIGAAQYPQNGSSEAELLKHADLAMYQAKAYGKNRCCLYTDDMAQKQQNALSIEQAMFEALQKGEFSLHYQPICNPVTREMLAVEALMRWRREDGPISPDVFIPLAEENGLINMMGSWALRTASLQLAHWDKQGLVLSHICVNVSPVQFHHPSFPATVQKALEDSQINPKRLVLEITEGALMKDPAKAEAVLHEVRNSGVRFSVDDFGTGYSSLAYLKRFPLSTLKVDKSFIRDMAASKSDRAIVSAVLSLALEMGLSVVAEGVETEEQCAFLVEKGCPTIQGWLICKALPANDLEELVQSKRLVVNAAAS